MNEHIDVDTLLRTIAGAASNNRRIRDGLNGILCEAGEDVIRFNSIKNALGHARVNARHLLRNITSAEEALNG